MRILINFGTYLFHRLSDSEGVYSWDVESKFFTKHVPNSCCVQPVLKAAFIGSAFNVKFGRVAEIHIMHHSTPKAGYS